MKITVSRSHIESARRKDSHHCMIADAIKEQLNVQYISVDTQAIKFSDPKTGMRVTFLTPPAAQNSILRWDRGIEVQPFVFNLDQPVVATPIRKHYQGRKSTKQSAQRRYAARIRADRMAPRLVKKKAKTKVSRFREFGVRRWTKNT